MVYAIFVRSVVSTLIKINHPGHYSPGSVGRDADPTPVVKDIYQVAIPNVAGLSVGGVDPDCLALNLSEPRRVVGK